MAKKSEPSETNNKKIHHWRHCQVGSHYVREHSMRIPPIGMRELRAGVSYDVINSQNITTANFIVGGQTFSTYSSSVRLALQLGAGITFKLKQHLLFVVDYNYEYRSGFTDNVGLVKLRYVF